MPIYMDLHILPGVTSKEVAQAHQLDLLFEGEHQCKCMTYWVDEARGNVFCLVEAPGKDAVEEMHRRSHGLIPHRIIEVENSVVEAFLGRISDPDEIAVMDSGLKVFHDPSFRTLLMTRLGDPILLRHRLGRTEADELVSQYRYLVRQELADHGGRETEHEGTDFIASFNLAGRAAACALAIREKISALDANNYLRIGVSGGEPVTNNNLLFGDTIRAADRLCFIAQDSRPRISSIVRERLAKDNLPGSEMNMISLSSDEDVFVTSLFEALENNWQEPAFMLDDYCQAMAMSKSQLYRKTVALAGMSPNALVKEYRLEKARELMRKKSPTVAEACFSSGFTSPSYFTKCFKNRYGLLPLSYLDGL